MNRNRLVLVLITALFALPLLAAWLLSMGAFGWRPGETVNLGALVQPPVALELGRLRPVDTERAMAEGWTMLYAFDGHCADACIRDVTGLRQVHVAAGRNRDKVSVLLLATAAMAADVPADLAAIYSQFHVYRDREARAVEALDQALANAGQAGGEVTGRAFLLDPDRNVILAYAPGFDPNHVNKDLKRLLKWSTQDDE